MAEPLRHPGPVLEQPAILVITGLMAAGKSTVAQSLAQRLPSAAHVRGDAFRRMIVSGRAELTPPLSAAGRAQLNLRHRLAALVADEYAKAGITAVVQDLYLGDDLSHFLASYVTVRSTSRSSHHGPTSSHGVRALAARSATAIGVSRPSTRCFASKRHSWASELTIRTSAWRRRSTPS